MEKPLTALYCFFPYVSLKKGDVSSAQHLWHRSRQRTSGYDARLEAHHCQTLQAGVMDPTPNCGEPSYCRLINPRVN
jgi:hypothetical protein